MLGFDLGLSDSKSNSLGLSSPISVNTGGQSNPVIWIVLGAVAILALVFFVKRKRRGK